MKKQSLLEGALILMIAGLFNRILGFLLRIILVKIIGDEGLGLFQMVHPVFITLLLLSTAGFPVAISKLIPEKLTKNDEQGALNLFKISIIFVSITGTLTTILLFFSADYIALQLFNDERIYFILIAITPALIICPLASCFRGYFQGFHTMLPTAVSQITEQISRIGGTLIIINMVNYLGLKYQAAGIAMGISIGEFSGLVMLVFLFFSHLQSRKFNLKNHTDKRTDKQKVNFIHNFKKIFKLGFPITMGRLINSFMLSGEAILIPRQLQLSGLSLGRATSLYGQLSGMVMQIIYLPTVITIALTTSLIPSVSSAYAANNLTKIKNNYEDIIRITTYLGFPMTVIFISNGVSICQLLFAFPEAGKILSGLALSATFIYFQQVSSGMLNGLGKPQLALRNLAFGSAIKLIGIYFLVPLPQWRTEGALIAITIGFIITAILNFISTGNIIGYQLNLLQVFIKPLACSVIIFLIEPHLEKYLTEISSIFPFLQNFAIHTILLLILLATIYLLLMFLLNAITPADIKRFKP